MSSANPALSRSSYLETQTRLPVLDWAPVPNRPGHHIIQTEMCPPDGSVAAVRFYMYWTGPTPPIGAFIGPVAMVAYEDDSDAIELASSRDETEELPGDVQDDDYADRYLVRGGIRFRGRGEVVSSDADEIVVTGFSYVNGRLRRWRAKVLINRKASRWSSFQAPRTGQICGFRGLLEAIETVPCNTFVITLESYSGPDSPASQPQSPSKSSGSNSAYLAARERYRQRKETSKNFGQQAPKETGAVASSSASSGHVSSSQEQVDNSLIGPRAELPASAEPGVSVQAGAGAGADAVEVVNNDATKKGKRRRMD
ncbi:hypothetical protein OC844_005719 [Tilletia horrida]|nr:hypothetical protein OC844_005719 [Tilletia horrida]